MKVTEPNIQINGSQLGHGQAIAVRVAVTSLFHDLATPESQAALGKDLADAYRSRLFEVLNMMGVA